MRSVGELGQLDGVVNIIEPRPVDSQHPVASLQTQQACFRNLTNSVFTEIKKIQFRRLRPGFESEVRFCKNRLYVLSNSTQSLFARTRGSDFEAGTHSLSKRMTSRQTWAPLQQFIRWELEGAVEGAGPAGRGVGTARAGYLMVNSYN
jgi:hypothetical protein